MIRFLIVIGWVIGGIFCFSNFATAGDRGHSQDIKLTYKAYWAGFVISKIYSQGQLTPESYQVDVSYEVTGLASIFSSMKNKISARGKFAADGSVRPLMFENQGSWSRYGFSNHTEFRPQDSKIIVHEYEFKFREDVKYIPISDELKYGPDMVSFYLGLTLDDEKMKINAQEKHQNIFGGFFLLDVSYRCTGNRIVKSRRSVYKGKALVCEFHDKIIDGAFVRVKKKRKSRRERRKHRKSRKKNTDTMEPTPLQIWYGKIDGVDNMVPVYSEFPFGWGKVRLYLAKIEVTAK